MRTVHELNQKELEELRERFFYQMQDDGSTEEIMGYIIYDEEEIPLSLLLDHYRDTYFVDEDFFCNTQN
jgi:hypothetical protein